MVEVLIGATIGTMVLTGVLSTFLMLGRLGANIGNYSVMETQSRRALEELSQDLRMAKDVTLNTAQSLTLVVPDNYTSTANKVTYSFDSAKGEFYRVPGDVSATSPRTILVRNVSTCSFAQFNRLNVATTSNTSTKRIQLTMIVRTTTKTVAAATNTILSASYILRNKPVN
jgi:Tfp pilus assembly protein PilW